jgi:predicted PurR-regulated permease PerM
MRGGIDAPFIVILVAAICGLIGLGPVGLVAGPVLMAFALQAAREANLGELL